MGWGIDFTSDIYLSSQNYDNNIYQVQDKIEELQVTIYNVNTKINMFAASSVKEVVPTEWVDEPIRWVNREVDELIDELHESIIQKYQLELYLEYLKEKQ